MDPMRLFSQMSKAAEASYVKPEQTEAILRLRQKLKAEGRLDQVRIEGDHSFVHRGSSAGTVLPEILSHQSPLILSGAPQKYNTSKGYTVIEPNRGMIASMASGLSQPTIYDSFAPGDALKVSRAKYQSSQFGGSTIWSIGDAQKLILEEADKMEAKRNRIVNVGKVKPMPIVSVGGVPLKLFPEPTGGRALFWGTILAVWVGSATATVICKAFDIRSAEDVRPAMRENLAPFAEYFRSQAQSMRTKVDNGEMGVDMSGFSTKLRGVMV